MSTLGSRPALVADGLSDAADPHAALGAWNPALAMPRGALVTGAPRRMGRAVAIGLGRLGWHVALHHRNAAEEAAAACAAIRAAGGEAQPVAGDLVGEGAEAVFAAASGAVGPIGLLVNNASIYEWDDIAGLTAGGWMRQQAINALAPVLLTQAFARALPADAKGAVVNIADARVLTDRSRHFSYAMSKQSLWTATRLLARELAPRIRVNAIGPGPTLPEAGQSEEQFLERCARLPLGRPASLDDIVNAVRFLVHTPSITGQLLALDGGDHLAD